ncbi:MAG: 4a-hydroxytetrahydrobiopterin dehydratase [Nanoarchaeota archaeon]
MMNLNEIQNEVANLDNWSIETDSISKVFVLENFRGALQFVNKVGEIAEKHNHHPDIVINYNNVKLTLTTHYEKGLSRKDFEVAKEIDKIV